MKVVYTYGVFDLFHVGHSRLLNEAKALGDKLIVGVYSDRAAESFKRYPIIPFEQRKEMVLNHKAVDEVVEQSQYHPDINLFHIKPDILAKGDGAGWSAKKVPPGSQIMKNLKGEVVRLPYHKGVSTSEIIERICS